MLLSHSAVNIQQTHYTTSYLYYIELMFTDVSEN